MSAMTYYTTNPALGRGLPEFSYEAVTYRNGVEIDRRINTLYTDGDASFVAELLEKFNVAGSRKNESDLSYVYTLLPRPARPKCKPAEIARVSRDQNELSLVLIAITKAQWRQNLTREEALALARALLDGAMDIAAHDAKTSKFECVSIHGAKVDSPLDQF